MPADGSRLVQTAFADPVSGIAIRQDENDNDAAPDNDNDRAADTDNASADDADASDNGNDNKSDSGSSGGGDVGSEAGFPRAALSDSQTEIQAGQLAQQQGGSDQVRQLGARMASENQGALSDAQNVAARYGVDPQQQTSEDQQRLADLSGRTGADFDQAYLKVVVSDQRADISEYEVAESGMRDDIAEYANQHRSMLEGERQAARDAADQLGIDVH